jgi:hypothetical protein
MDVTGFDTMDTYPVDDVIVRHYFSSWDGSWGLCSTLAAQTAVLTSAIDCTESMACANTSGGNDNSSGGILPRTFA